MTARQCHSQIYAIQISLNAGELKEQLEFRTLSLLVECGMYNEKYQNEKLYYTNILRKLSGQHLQTFSLKDCEFTLVTHRYWLETFKTDLLIWLDWKKDWTKCNLTTGELEYKEKRRYKLSDLIFSISWWPSLDKVRINKAIKNIPQNSLTEIYNSSSIDSQIIPN